MQAEDLALIHETRRKLADGRARQTRIAARIAQASVASTIGVTGAAVWHWEKGLANPNDQHALRYGRILQTLERSITGAAN